MKATETVEGIGAAGVRTNGATEAMETVRAMEATRTMEAPIWGTTCRSPTSYKCNFKKKNT